MFAGSNDGTAILWDATTGAKIRDLQGYANSRWAVTPEGGWIVNTGINATPNIWPTNMSYIIADLTRNICAPPDDDQSAARIRPGRAATSSWQQSQATSGFMMRCVAEQDHRNMWAGMGQRYLPRRIHAYFEAIALTTRRCASTVTRAIRGIRKPSGVRAWPANVKVYSATPAAAAGAGPAAPSLLSSAASGR